MVVGHWLLTLDDSPQIGRRSTPVLPPERLRKAITEGTYEGGGRKYSCETEVKEATSLLLNRLADTY